MLGIKLLIDKLIQSLIELVDGDENSTSKISRPTCVSSSSTANKSVMEYLEFKFISLLIYIP